jgi:hypothetical protein
MSIARWTRPPERAAKKVSCKSLGRPPSTGIIRPTDLTPLAAGAGEDFGVDAGGDAKDFGLDTAEEASEDFGSDVGEDVGADFGSDMGDDVGADFVAGAGDDVIASGGRGVKSDTCGNGSLHLSGTDGEGKSRSSFSVSVTFTRRGLDAPGAGAEDKSRSSLSLSLTRRGLDAPGARAEDGDADVDGTRRGNFGAGAGEDVSGDFGAGVWGNAGAASGGFCGGAGWNRNKASQSFGMAIIFCTPGEKSIESSL